jgi:copper oxidase (laccase) domain-containing protein
MPFQSNGEIIYYQFDLFDQSVLHAIFSRRGGISPTPWQSLNMGSTVGDDINRVRENRRLGLTALSLKPM